MAVDFVRLWGCHVPGAQAMPIFLRTAGKKAKAAQRCLQPPVPVGRPVLPVTQARRAKLLDEFLHCLLKRGLTCGNAG